MTLDLCITQTCAYTINERNTNVPAAENSNRLKIALRRILVSITRLFPSFHDVDEANLRNSLYLSMKRFHKNKSQ